MGRIIFTSSFYPSTNLELTFATNLANLYHDYKERLISNPLKIGFI
jgi:hypothetical protein